MDANFSLDPMSFTLRSRGVCVCGEAASKHKHTQTRHHPNIPIRASKVQSKLSFHHTLTHTQKQEEAIC